MFCLPAVVTVPFIEMINLGSFEFAAVGTYLAAVLSVVLVGTGVGILSSHSTRAIPKSHRNVKPLRPVARPISAVHKAAA